MLPQMQLTNSSMINLSSIQSTIAHDVELVASLHDNEAAAAAASSAQIYGKLCIIGYSFVVISMAFFTVAASLRVVAKKWNIQSQSINFIAVRSTNLLVNLVFGTYGFYHYNFTLPGMSTLKVTERIVGFQQYANFPCIQIGYNLWSIPAGVVIIGDDAAMIGHHIATICVSAISAFATTGFRYHAPFFFGLIEVSSVLLAIMNYCKENKEWSDKYCPTLAAAIRPAFGVVFLITRVYMWTPNIVDVLRCSCMLLWTSHSLLTRLILGLFIICVVFLTSLQFYWGSLVVKGIAKLLAGLSVKRVKEVKVD